MGKIVDPRFVYLGVNSADAVELFGLIGADLEAAGRIRPTIAGGLVAQVAFYPTGSLSQRGSAIRHIDAGNVLEDTIAVATLAAPVTLSSLGGSAHEVVEVSTVFVLALKDPEQHARILSRIVPRVQDAAFLQSLAAADRTTVAGLVAAATGITDEEAGEGTLADSLLTRAVAAAGDTRELRFGPGVIAQTGEVFRKQFPGSKVLVVADQNTFSAAGEQVVASLRKAGIDFAADPYIFQGRPTLQTSYENVTIVREQLAALDDTVCCTIASGTLNDVVKLAAGELGRPYLVVCTAASVDGYTAYGASIARDGFKITRPCPAPAALVADTVVMAAAPQRLTATGYGDLIEKIPAGADWILADEIDVEPIDLDVWELVQPSAKVALAAPARVAAGDLAAVTALAEANLLSGLAMQALRSSRPSSGGGHLFSHVWEMEGHGLRWEPPLSHGFKVGIGTVASSALWAEALKIDLAGIDIARIVAMAPTPADIEVRCRSLMSPHVAEAAIQQSLTKLVTGDDLRDRLRTIQRRWPQIRQRCAEQLLGPQEVADRLRIAGAPYHPEQIGIDMERFRKTHFQAQLIRARYTILDVLAELGVFDQIVGRLFRPDGFWGLQPRTVS